MTLINKVKLLFVNTIKEHPFSIISFFIAMVLHAILNVYYDSIYFDDEIDGIDMAPSIFSEETANRLSLVFLILIGFSLGALLCEAIHLYRKEKNINYSLKRIPNLLCYGIITLLTALSPIPYGLIELFPSISSFFGEAKQSYSDYFRNIFLFILFAVAVLVIFLLYKKSNESFETYTAKSFCGIIKCLTVFTLLFFGVWGIVSAFFTLIIETTSYNLPFYIIIILSGLVGFPCFISALSKTNEPLSKFFKTIIYYVLPTIISIAGFIVYIYIIKIIFTRSFPLSDVFNITACLFIFGVIIWTMAQGCAKDKIPKPLMFLPFVFIPFIVLQVIFILARIYNYGFTTNRYLGLALIIFEIIYFAIYIFRLRKDIDIISYNLFFAIAIICISFIIPGINNNSIVTLSQRPHIDKFLKLGEKATNTDKKLAFNAYLEIQKDGGISGNNYLNNLNSDDITSLDSLYEDVNDYTSYYDDNSDNNFYISVSSDFNGNIDISGYNSLIVSAAINKEIDIEYKNENKTHLDSISISIDGEDFGTADISAQIKKLIELEKEYQNSINDEAICDQILSKQTEVLSKPFDLSDGGKLFITNLDINGTYVDDAEGYKIDDLYIYGFVLN